LASADAVNVEPAVLMIVQVTIILYIYVDYTIFFIAAIEHD